MLSKKRKWMAFARVLIALPYLIGLDLAYAQVTTLKFYTMKSKDIWEGVVRDFEKQNPDIRIHITEFDLNEYNYALRSLLIADAPDLIRWYSGYRMKPYVDAKLLDDISDVWKKERLNTTLAPALAASSYKQRQWALPYTYYNWGLYYRKDLFQKQGLKPPSNWDDLLSLCDKLKTAGITPITIGTKEPWVAAAWFDYLNLRINGYPFHMKLSNQGLISYRDARVKNVFAHWEQLLSKKCFNSNHTTLTWQQSAASIVHSKAAMTLGGLFYSAYFENQGLKSSQIGFIPFPVVNPKIERAEVAPIDSLHIPARAKNKAQARKFLAFVAKTAPQVQISKGMNQLPINTNALKQTRTQFTPSMLEGYKLLSNTKQLAQFYDRDTPPEMAEAGLAGFKRFMLHPAQLDSILSHLDQVRIRAYKE